MPLIDFPNVPMAPGVPNLRRTLGGIGAITGIIGAVEGLDQLGLIDALLGPQWGLFDKSGQIALRPDSVISFEYRGEEKVATHPVEQGGFSSYNKVAMPYDIRMVIACNGQGEMTRQAIISDLEALKASTDLYDVITPDFTYLDVNLVAYDYRRQSRNGVTLLQIEIQLKEIRTTARTFLPSTAEPSGASPIAVGGVKSRDLTTQEEAGLYIGVFE